MVAQSLIIDSRLQDHLPVSYDQRLPRRYVHTPILQTKQDSPYPSCIVADAGEQYDPKQSLNYHLDAGTGALRIASLETLCRKGTLIDTMA